MINLMKFIYLVIALVYKIRLIRTFIKFSTPSVELAKVKLRIKKIMMRKITSMLKQWVHRLNQIHMKELEEKKQKWVKEQKIHMEAVRRMCNSVIISRKRLLKQSKKNQKNNQKSQ